MGQKDESKAEWLLAKTVLTVWSRVISSEAVDQW